MRIALLAAALLGACAPQPKAATPDESPAAPPVSASCDAAKVQALVGRTIDAALRAEAMQRAGARSSRVIPPGAMVTMDYRPDRLNIETDAAGNATRFRCG